MPAVQHAHGLHQPRIDPGQVGAFGDHVSRDFQEIDDLAYPEPVPAAADVQLGR